MVNLFLLVAQALAAGPDSIAPMEPDLAALTAAAASCSPGPPDASGEPGTTVMVLTFVEGATRPTVGPSHREHLDLQGHECLVAAVGALSTEPAAEVRSQTVRFTVVDGAYLASAAERDEVVGTLSPAEIDRVVKDHLSTVRSCYQRALTTDRRLFGRLAVKFVISADGTVNSAKVKSSSLGEASVEDCVVGSFERMVFPVSEDGGIVVVNYPFIFMPDGGAPPPGVVDTARACLAESPPGTSVQARLERARGKSVDLELKTVQALPPQARSCLDEALRGAGRPPKGSPWFLFVER